MRAWQVRRAWQPHPNGLRAWERTYQPLMAWVQAPPQAAVSGAAAPPAREVNHEDRDLCTGVHPAPSYLEQRWSEGCRNAAELARELARRGSDVRPRVVRAWATKRRRAEADALDAGVREAVGRWKAPTINRTAFLLQADRTALRQEDRDFVDRLLEKAPGLAAVANLADRLARLLRQQSSESLDDWFKDARFSALARLAAGLWRDLEAVRGAVTMPWSTSPVEGQISRLKMIKRQMYGHAGFDLLRQRVLYPA
jgi:transposase